ncbi:MAG: D-amino-acid transaminase [Tepidisphaeraceae bacterium]|jgi:D-alanine transaminase
MSETIWFNGEVIPASAVRIDPEDRGYQFADGIYEVVRIYNRRLFTLREHLDRLYKSAAGISLSIPVTPAELSRHLEDFTQQHAPDQGFIYLQVTRGVAPRNHLFPDKTTATMLFYARPLPPQAEPGAAPGAALHSVPDERWKRCWIKSIALLANVLAKNTAIAAGADEAVFIHDGCVTECSASNLFVVSAGTVLTHPVGPKVLPGITRLVLLDLAGSLGIPVEERPIREAEALAADELFITSTTREISWVARWNTYPVGGGKCGPITMRLHRAIREKVRGDSARAV